MDIAQYSVNKRESVCAFGEEANSSKELSSCV